MLTRLPLSLMVELAVDCSTKYSVPRALMNSGGGWSSATSLLTDKGELARCVGAGEGRERGGRVVERERGRHRDDQVPALGQLEDPAPHLGPERPAGRVRGADEDVPVRLGPGRGGDGD